MNIQWGQTFLAAAEAENFRKAAEQLFVTQPAVTKQIQRLEQELAIQLFERTGKSVKLTEAGLAFLPRAQEMARSVQENLSGFTAWKQGYSKQMILACAPQTASSFLPSYLQKFVKEFPHIDVHVEIASSYEIGEKVSSGAAHIGLARMPSVYRGTLSTPVHEEPVVLAAPLPSHGKERDLLKDYRLLTDNHPVYWEELMKKIKRQHAHVQTMRVSQVEVTKRFIEAGLGISYLPPSVVKEEAALKKLRIVASEVTRGFQSVTYLIEKTETRETAFFKQLVERKENKIKL